jgi:hypothetical protein
MKVKELKRILNKLDEELEVMMSTDEEGNGYGLLRSVVGDGYRDGDGGLYFDEHGWEGNCFDTEEEWEEYKRKNSRVVVLFP